MSVAENANNESEVKVVAVESAYDDEVTNEDIVALEKHVREHFGDPEDLVLVSGPAW